MESNNVREIIQQNIRKKNHFSDKLMPKIFLFMALISVVTTFGIVYTLIFDSIKFFSQVPYSIHTVFEMQA